ncbi:hypothetical protein JKP75_06870 [Blastococcus sp. TML/M2B]|uniref:hypothetical protein n=1 Tax=Blastococcus sp. TML/M2B TaxID=2798727 RepID=UPI00190D7666|nr:hypothetical protein [Blastococcus sp. TML/M2B]MBN1092312.1 hypothetical protein [Blastococcus sp. TML/M2B]
MTLTACGGSSSDGGTTTESGAAGQESSPGDVLTAGQLSTVLLSPADLPEGYVLSSSTDDEEEDDTDFGTSECAAALEAGIGDDDDSDVVAEVERSFDAGEEAISSLSQSVSSNEDEDALADALDELKGIIDDCDELTFSADGVPVTLSISTLDVPEHGDDTLGIRMRGQVSAFPIEFALGFNRLGHNMHSVFVGGLGEADVPALRAAMDAGFEKLEKAHLVAKDAPVASETPADSPSSSLNTGGPGAYSGTTEDGVEIALALPAPATAPLASDVAAYLQAVGGPFADVTLVQVELTNNSTEETYLGGVTVVGKDGTQVELEDLVGLLNETDDVDPDAYSATGGDLNMQLSDAQLGDLKPRAKGSQLFALRSMAPEDVVDVYVSASYTDVQLALD